MQMKFDFVQWTNKKLTWKIESAFTELCVIYGIMDNAHPRGVIVWLKTVIFLSFAILIGKTVIFYIEAVILEFPECCAIRRKN